MKQLASRLWARITAIVLIVIQVWICVFNCFSMVFLSEHNALFHDRPGAEEDLIAELMQRDINYLQLPIRMSQNLTDPDFSDRFRTVIENSYKPKESNFIFTIYREDGEQLVGNEMVTDETALLVVDQQILDQSKQRTILRQFRSEHAAQAFEESLQKEFDPEKYDFEFNWEWESDNSIRFTGKLTPIIQCRLKAALREPMTAKDRYYYAVNAFRQISGLRVIMIILTPLMIVGILVLLAFLMIGAGRRENTDQIYRRWPDKIPFDLFAFLLALLAFAPQIILKLPSIRNSLNGKDHLFWIVFVALVRILRILLALWLLVSFARRYKTHTLARNTVVYHAYQGLKKSGRYMIENIPSIWRGLVIWTVLSVIEGYYIIYSTNTFVTLIWVIEKIVVTVMCTFLIINFRKLEQGSRALCRGELDTKVNLNWMFPAMRRHGENLNGISEALRSSLEEQMRSERMQSELIANVSHDIKTPLTSIVSYVELLKKDGLDSPDAEAYLEVLERQSEKLKKLLGDLVEASKVASGSITVVPETIDGNLLLTQAAGEYVERMQERNLTLVYDLCDKPLLIRADPNLLWRVFDNLLNNAQKYAQSGTRVYLSTRLQNDTAEITFRNISDQMLNVSPDELMERFVRGDSSRNTEGSGLGLSIAKSLTELQGGRFDLSIDGDLFKIVIEFRPGDEEPENDPPA